MDLMKRRYSILLFVVTVLLAFIMQFYITYENYPIMPWTTKEDILLHMNWFTFGGIFLGTAAITKIHWIFCERF